MMIKSKLVSNPIIGFSRCKISTWFRERSDYRERATREVYYSREAIVSKNLIIWWGGG